MAQGVTPDGIAPGSRVNPTTYRKLYAKVVDNILTSRTYFSRLMGMGEPFNGKTFDIPIKVVDSGLGQFYSGLELLNSSASDTLIELSYAHTAFAQPVVSIMLESFANSGPQQAIDLDVFKMEEAVSEAVQALGTAMYGTGAGKQPLGLEALVDDGSNTATIGGQARATYPTLNSTVTASGGQLTLAKLATLDDTISASGLETEAPNIHLTTKTIWSLYEQLLTPTVRAEYASVGYPQVPIRGSDMVRSRSELKGGAGFTALSYRGMPTIKDDAATSGVWYMLNERYLMWKGRNVVPTKYSGYLDKVTLGARSTIEGVGADTPPTDYGWFFQKMQDMPNQAGMIGRYHVIGQNCVSQPRRQGKLTGVTSV